MNNFFLLHPARGLRYAVADPGKQKGGQASEGKHGAPAEMTSDTVVGERGEEEPEVVAGVHETGAGDAPIFGPLFRDKSAAHRPFAADPDSCQKAQNGELPYVGREGA